MSRFYAPAFILLALPISAAFSQPVGEGELRIIAPDGTPRGFCPLKHTDVIADVAGLVSRVTVRQEFATDSKEKIEAIYVFPLPQNAAVDDMTMTVGSRTIRGRIKERGEARAIYEDAKARGHVASLLDQERANIFTQSVANIEPGERVLIEVSYMDMLKYEDGQYELMFPMVVGPRYIPGHMQGRSGTGWAPDTNKVPDASRITPLVAPKGERAGHDISLRVSLDAGQRLAEVTSPSHDIAVVRDRRGRATVTLKDLATIPNKDFVLRFRTGAEGIGDAMLAHVDARGGFFTLILEPPARVQPDQVVPRELIFVLDTSGSMMGQPIDKAKAVMSRAMNAMRPGDTFNMITFSGDTSILWDKPRPATQANRAAAQQFLESRRSGGGTEMMKAIDAALTQTLRESAAVLSAADLSNLPADGRVVRVRMPRLSIEKVAEPGITRGLIKLHIDANRSIQACAGQWAAFDDLFARNHDRDWLLEGRWSTVNGERWLELDAATSPVNFAGVQPMRIAMFMTDGYVGNDLEIIDAVKKHAATTRVFSLGIGSSVNRFLMDGMARAGRGEVQYVLLDDDADAAVQQLAERIETPVLSDISVDWGGGSITDVRPAMIADLFASKPVVIHGRYSGAFRGTIRLRGMTGAGPFERAIDVDLPGSGVEHPALASLWARAKVADVLDRDLIGLQRGQPNAAVRKDVLALGLEYSILTPFTSFVAVEEMRITSGGEARTIAVPVEMPEGVSREGVFGDGFAQAKLHFVGGFAGQPAPRSAGASRLQTLTYLSDDDEQKDKASRPAQPAERLDRELKELVVRVKRQGGKGDLGKLKVRDGKVEVMIALNDVSEKTMAALKALGVEVLSQSKSINLVIARIAVDKLEALEKLDCVRRIDPVR